MLPKQEMGTFLELCTTYQHSQSTCGNSNITVIVISPTFAAKESCYTQNIAPNFPQIPQLLMHLPIPEAFQSIRTYDYI